MVFPPATVLTCMAVEDCVEGLAHTRLLKLNASVRSDPELFKAAGALKNVEDIPGSRKDAGWRGFLRVPKLSWCLSQNQSVKLCEVRWAPGGLPAEDTLLRRLVRLVSTAPGNERFPDRYAVEKALLCDSEQRADAFLNRAEELESRYNDRVFSLRAEMFRGGEECAGWRHEILTRFSEKYSNLRPDLAHVQVRLAFAAVHSERDARKIMDNNFATLSKTDPGYFGQGLYLTLDAEYAVETYGMKYFGLDKVPLLVCAVLTGNSFPIIECPYELNSSGQVRTRKVVDEHDNTTREPVKAGYMGKPIKDGADSHVAVVRHNERIDQFIPCKPPDWGDPFNP